MGATCSKRNRRETLRLKNSTLSANLPPYEFFKLFCSEEFFELVAHETNIRSIQRYTVGFHFAVDRGTRDREHPSKSYHLSP